MLRVTVELVPHGDESRKRTLCTMDIINTGQNPKRPVYGDYVVCSSDDYGNCETHITNHLRGDGFWPLVAKAAYPYMTRGEEQLQTDGK